LEPKRPNRLRQPASRIVSYADREHLAGTNADRENKEKIATAWSTVTEDMTNSLQARQIVHDFNE